MLSDQSLRDFRAWLDRMPPAHFDRRARGAFDVMPDERGEHKRRFLARLREGISLKQAYDLFEYFRRKCDTDDEKQLWEWLAGHVVSPPRRNGNAHT
jgi:hypothetical protein